MTYLSKTSVTADGIVRDFTVPFGYIDKSHVKVYKDAVLDSSYTWVTAGQIQWAAAPTAGTVILIQRVTPQTVLVSWQDGAKLKAVDLNKQAQQTIYLCQEVIDGYGIASDAVVLAEAAATAANASALAAAAAQAAAEAAETALADVPKDASWITTGVFNAARIPAIGAYSKLTSSSLVAITAAATATVNRLHYVTGTSADYTVNMPAGPTTGDVVGFVIGDYSVASKQFKLDAGGTIKIAGRTRYLVLLHTNVALFQWDGAQWIPLVLDIDTPWIDGGTTTITGAGSNPTKGTIGVDKVRWRRVGDSIEQTINFYQSTAGGAGSGTYDFGIANGYTWDTNKCDAVGPVGNPTLGAASIGSATSSRSGGVQPGLTASGVSLFYSDSTTLLQAVSGSSLPLSTSGRQYSAQFVVPIVNW